jgi:hypothetical protein
MKKYSVLVNGTNFKLKEKGELKRHGFFSTRYVMANTVKEAEAKAIELVKGEVSKYFVKDLNEPAFIFVDEVSKLESFEGVSVPGKGFSLYPEKRRSKFTMKMLRNFK